jgi:regulator of protease activity HflC (stomatin/prohibitin superfamily)
MQLGKLTAKYIIPISILSLIALSIIAVKFFIIKVGIDEVGVRTVVWGMDRGIVQKDHGPGWHRAISGIDLWDLYDATVQTLEFAKEPSRVGHDERREVMVRTADDYDVGVDMTVKYQIMKGAAWKLRETLGPGERYKIIVENEARDAARSVFGNMIERDLYDPDQKRKRAEECKLQLVERLLPRYVNIIDVLILEIRFDPQLERKIKNIRLAELDNVLNISKALAADRRGITQTIDADTEAIAQRIAGDRDRTITVLDAETTKTTIEMIAEADKYLVQTMAAGDLYRQERVAEGTLLVKKAQAVGEQLRREALSGVGGDIIIAMEAARNMNLADVNLSSLDLNLLDVDEMATRLGVSDPKGRLRVDPKTFEQVQEILRHPKDGTR